MADWGNVEQMRAYFSESLEIALDQWHEIITQPDITTGEIDQERDIILKNIKMSLVDARLWPATYKTIDAITPHIEVKSLWSEWSRLLNNAITVCRDVGQSKHLAKLYHSLGRALLPLNEYSSGETAYLKAIRLARAIGDETNEARACSNLGYYYIDRGHWWRCEVLCCHALGIFERLENAHGQAHTLNHLGVLYTRQGEYYDKGEKALRDACDIWERNGDSYGLMLGYMNLGLLYHEKRDGDTSIAWSEKALQYADKLEDRVIAGRIKVTIGAAHLTNKDYQKAKPLLFDALETSQDANDIVTVARVKINLGEAYMEEGEIEAGLSLLRESIAMFAAMGNIDGLVSGLDYLNQYTDSHSANDVNELVEKLKKTLAAAAATATT